jgi:hypothetical protein
MGTGRFLMVLRAVLFLGVSRLAWSDSPPADGSDIPEKIMAFEAIIAKDRKEMFPASPSSATNAPASMLPAVVTNAAVTNEAQGPRRPLKEQDKVMRIFGTLKINATRGDYTDALLSAESLALIDKSPAAQGALKDLIAEFLALRTAQERRVAADVDKVLADVTNAVVSAREPKDLDPILVEIAGAMVRKIDPYTTTHISETSRLVDADRFAKNWQSYLFDKAAGDKQSCRFDLDELCRMNDTFRPLPRSQLLQLRHDLEAPPSLHP